MIERVSKAIEQRAEEFCADKGEGRFRSGDWFHLSDAEVPVFGIS